VRVVRRGVWTLFGVEVQGDRDITVRGVSVWIGRWKIERMWDEEAVRV
jgi:hypothetical protein